MDNSATGQIFPHFHFAFKHSDCIVEIAATRPGIAAHREAQAWCPVIVSELLSEVAEKYLLSTLISA